ncbi:MAG: Na+/H+ antiporter NhaA [Gammaproteobacteria bacterium]|nr:Na+/H+ antiporter NhaA [Gammaproteobacteria bacterium]
MKSTQVRLSRLFLEFTESEQVAGLILILCAVVSIAIANSTLGTSYLDFWHSKIGFETTTIRLKYSIDHWINDALMAIFFLLVGLEIERELYVGELSDLKNALLPVVAAIGGMATPALLYILLNLGTETQAGFGIPMATDIAFALGVLALLGDSIPVSLKIFLTALAILDDLGAIILIALFYASDLSLVYLLLASGIFIVMVIMNRLNVSRLFPYLILGAVMWYCMLNSGVHATLAGVLLAFVIPFDRGDEESPSWRLEHFLQKPVAFLILPAFALANTAVVLENNWFEGLMTANSLGICAGLLLGKPLGIVLFSVAAIKAGVSQLPEELTFRHMIGAGFLGGIGFTMSIFITLLAFDNPEIIASSKITILLTSLLAGAIGFLVLNRRISA